MPGTFRWPHGSFPKDMRPGRSSLQTRGPPESLCCWKESKTQRGGDRCEIRKQPDETERQRQEKIKTEK